MNMEKVLEGLYKEFDKWQGILDAEENGFGYGVRADKSLYQILGSIGRKITRVEKALRIDYPFYFGSEVA